MAAWVWIILLLAAGTALGQTSLLIEEGSPAEVGISVLEYGVYLQVGGKTYKAVAVYLPTFVEAMFLPANTTVRVPLYGGKILFVPVEEAEPPAAVGYILTDKGRIIFTEDAPAIAFAETDNYTKITKHPVQKAKVVEKRLPPPRGLAPRPTSSELVDQAAKPETGVGEEGPAAASINAQVAPLSLPTGTVVEAVGAIYTLGRINGGQYARPYNVTNVNPPCTPPGNGVHIIYLGYGVKHAAVGVAPVQSGQTRLNITIYSVENGRCVKLDSLVYQYDSSWGRYFAYFIVGEKTNKYPNPVSVSGKVLAVAIQNMGTAAVSLNISVAYHREVKAEYQTSNYNLQQAKFRVSSINYFSRVVFAPLIPPDGVTDARLVIDGYLLTDDVSSGRCQYSRLNFDVYINGIYEGRGTAYCYALDSSTCRCDFDYAFTYSAAPFSLRYAKGFGRGVVLVTLEFKRPDGGAPRIRYFEGGLRVRGFFWREVYRSDDLTSWTDGVQTIMYYHGVGCTRTDANNGQLQINKACQVLVEVLSRGNTGSGARLAFVVAAANEGGNPPHFVRLDFKQSGIRNPGESYQLYHAYSSAPQPVNMPWWLVIARVAYDAIAMLLGLVTSGLGSVLLSLATWAGGQVLDRATAQVNYYVSGDTYVVYWDNSWSTSTPRYFIIIVNDVTGSGVTLELTYLHFGYNTGGWWPEMYYFTGISTKGSLPGSLIEGGPSEPFSWWAFRGLATRDTFTPVR